MNELYNLVTLPDKVRARKGIEHTPAEIEAQPRLWTENFKILEKRREEILSFLDERTLSTKKPRVILTGAGSSAYIGLSAQNLLRHRWQLDVDARPTTDIVTHWGSILLKGADNTLISFSRSGNSPESIGAFFLAEKFCPRISHIIVTCNKDGKLAELGKGKNNALLLLLSEGTNDRGLAMTASFTTMLMTAQFLAHAKDPETYQPIVKDLSEATGRGDQTAI
jgi:tagatose-6-phosphate ketose/aldose isomerase